MPYVPDQQDPNKQNPNQLQTTSAPGSGPAGAGKGGTPQSTPAQPFQNLQAYLGANQGQVGAQADKIAGDLNNQYGQVQSDVNAGVKDFGTQVKSGYAAPNQQVVDSAASNPTDFASDPNNVKAFQSLYNDSYTGPSNFEGTQTFGNLNAEVNKAKNNADLVKSNEGLQTYFQGQNPNATKGGNILDSVLLQGTPEAYGKVTTAAQPYASLTDWLNGNVTKADQGVTDAQKTAQDTATGVQNRFTGEGGVIPGFENDFTNRLNQTRTDLQTNTDKAVSDLKAGKELTPDEAALLQSSNQDIASLRGAGGALNSDYQVPFDIGTYLQQTNPNATILPSNFATSDEYKKAAALSQLTGEDLTSFLNQANVGQAGTAPKSIANLNTKATLDLNESLRQKDAQYIQSHDLSHDPAQKQFQLDLIARNPGLLDPAQNPTANEWNTWYQANSTQVQPPVIAPRTGPVQPGDVTAPGMGGGPGVF